MEKYDFIKCMNLHRRLKKRIRGTVFIALEDGVLTININPDKWIRGVRYRRNINDITNRFDVEEMAQEIEYDYVRFIKNKFFIEDE